MTKSELVAKIQERCPDLGRRLVEDAVSLFFNEIASSLQKGNRIELRGFGSFSVRKRNERIGRNPRTGETVSVEGKNIPFFKAGKAFRELLNKPAATAHAVNLSPRQSTPSLHTSH
jgi:integration host factor subunit beta